MQLPGNYNHHERSTLAQAQSDSDSREIVAGKDVRQLSYRWSDGNDHVINPWFDVRAYGAKGDGVTDDTAAIQACFAAARLVGGTVLFPPGTYICKSQWNIDEFAVVGSGMGAGSAKQTIIQFQALGTDAGIITRLASTTNYSIGISNMRIDANSWDATLGCRGYGMDLEARINLDHVMVTGFYKSNIFLHGGVSGDGPYNSVLKNIYSEKSKEHGILIGTGANNITLIEPYCAYNGAPSFGVAPSASSLYDGIHIERDNAGNPGGVYQSYVPESIVIIGGNGFANSRYGWYLGQIQNSNVSLGYCEGNYGSAGDGKQVYLGNDVIYCSVNIPTIAGGVANVENAASYYRYNNNIWCQGSLLCSGANKENYMLANLQNYFGFTGDPYGAGITDGVNGRYDAATKTWLLSLFGTAEIKIGAGTAILRALANQIILPTSDTYLGTVRLYAGNGSPESTITATLGSFYFRTDGSGLVYRKSTNTGNTGWIQLISTKDNPTFGDGTASAFVTINGGDGANADIGLNNAGSELWTIRRESTAISGGATGDGGANFELLARKNDQSLIDRPIKIARAAGSPVLFSRAIGYQSGVGGTVTQTTNKSTGVTLSKVSGQITMNNAALAAGAVVSFTWTNTLIAATDGLILNNQSGGTPGAYHFDYQCAAGSAVITVRNLTAGALSEAIVIGFVLVKGVTA